MSMKTEFIEDTKPGRKDLARVLESIRRNSILFLGGLVLWVALAILLSGSGMQRDSYRFELLFFTPFLVYVFIIYWIQRTRVTVAAEKRSYSDILCIILVFSILFRALFMLTTPVLSDDVYRHYWEGKMSTNGINPYLQAPDDEELSEYRDSEWENINNKDVAASYPPLTQIAFSLSYLIHPSIFTLKFVFVLFDILSICVVFLILKNFNIDPRYSIIYAWSPLVVIEFAHSGHNDSLAIFLTLLSFLFLQKDMRTASAVALSLGFLAKLFPMLFAPILFRTWGKKNTCVYFVVIILFYIPFMGAGYHLFSGTSSYADRWLFNGSVFPLLVHFLEYFTNSQTSIDLAKIFIILIFVTVVTYFFVRSRSCKDKPYQLFKYAFLLIGLYLILTPTFHPWYIIWIIPFLCVFRPRSWILLTGLVTLSYIVYIEYDSTGAWSELWWVRVIDYLPFYLVLLYEFVHHSKFLERIDLFWTSHRKVKIEHEQMLDTV